MRKAFVGLLLLVGAGIAAQGSIAYADELELSPSRAAARASRLMKLGAAATGDTTFVGYSIKQDDGVSAVPNYWSIWAVKDDDPDVNAFAPNLQPYGVWDFNSEVNGDSTQGFWSVRYQYFQTLNSVLNDKDRPAFGLDYGNVCNSINPSDAKRRIGVVGVWHVDAGAGQTALQPGAGGFKREDCPGPNDVGTGSCFIPSPTWTALSGSSSAWMGLRAHGDRSYLDPITGNAYNHAVMQFNSLFNASGANAFQIGTATKLPGYMTFMDQMMYRDITGIGATDDVEIQFTYRTAMDTDFDTQPNRRVGWYNCDPLSIVQQNAGGADNFISSSDAGTNAPRDSFMVYVGAEAEGSVLLSDGNSYPIAGASDPNGMQRWFGQVIRANEGLYKEIFSVAGTNAATTETILIPEAALDNLLTSGRLRLVFRVKTNSRGDDQWTSFSSGTVGAAIVDDVKVKIGAGAQFTLGNFEAVTDIDNTASATLKWRTTGKAPQPFWHVDKVSDFTVIDVCGNLAQDLCDLGGGGYVMGDHDQGHENTDDIGTGQHEVWDGILSPAVYLIVPTTGKNNFGLNTEMITATRDIFVFYDYQSGGFDPFTTGNTWRQICLNFPAAQQHVDNAPTGGTPGPEDVAVKAWGETRIPGSFFFDDVPECIPSAFSLFAAGLMVTSNANGMPDSIRVGIQKATLCARLGATSCGDPQLQSFFDNVALVFVDGAAPPEITMSIWQPYSDTFPANESGAIASDFAAAKFDTTIAYTKSGLNITPLGGGENRWNVPGDTTVVSTSGTSVRIDLIFRILPGPGNYIDPTATTVGANYGRIKKVAKDGTGAGNFAVSNFNSNNFWESYLANNGEYGTGGTEGVGGPGHPAKPKWDPHTWNSARCDTAQPNVFPVAARKLADALNPGLFMTAYHESDTRATITRLGIQRNLCFLVDPNAALTDLTCSGPPQWILDGAPSNGFDGNATTLEGTKIIPDGILTPGSHVQYFFRKRVPATGTLLRVRHTPDSVTVLPQTGETNFDGHRWQQFGVLPDTWKRAAYRHPVLGSLGLGEACFLVVDHGDRRGSENDWIGVSDSLGMNQAAKRGGHNGWFTKTGGDPNAAGDNFYYYNAANPPSFEGSGWPSRHGGQPGTTWDYYQVKASESLTAPPGTIGAREGMRDVTNPINARRSRLAPTENMLKFLYKMIMEQTGDIKNGLYGPYNNRSEKDVIVLRNWLLQGNTSTPDRGLYVMGEGAVESNTSVVNQSAMSDQLGFNSDYLGVSLLDGGYYNFSGNIATVVDFTVTPQITGDQTVELGLIDFCFQELDVLQRNAALATTVEAAYYDDPDPMDAITYVHTVIKRHHSTKPWIAQTDGSDISDVTSYQNSSRTGRLFYIQRVLNNVFTIGCALTGAPGVILDTPGANDGRVFNFMSLRNTPLQSGNASVVFGLTKADRVEVKVYDVSGRLVRTLADRSFPAGEHMLNWDGVDNAGRQVARGVYFTQVRFLNSKFTEARKLVVLK